MPSDIRSRRSRFQDSSTFGKKGRGQEPVPLPEQARSLSLKERHASTPYHLLAPVTHRPHPTTAGSRREFPGLFACAGQSRKVLSRSAPMAFAYGADPVSWWGRFPCFHLDGRRTDSLRVRPAWPSSLCGAPKRPATLETLTLGNCFPVGEGTPGPEERLSPYLWWDGPAPDSLHRPCAGRGTTTPLQPGRSSTAGAPSSGNRSFPCWRPVGGVPDLHRCAVRAFPTAHRLCQKLHPVK